MHPFVPLQDNEGYRAMIGQLESWLIEITGYDAMSMQPNSGAQGEYADEDITDGAQPDETLNEDDEEE